MALVLYVISKYCLEKEKNQSDLQLKGVSLSNFHVQCLFIAGNLFSGS